MKTNRAELWGCVGSGSQSSSASSQFDVVSNIQHRRIDTRDGLLSDYSDEVVHLRCSPYSLSSFVASIFRRSGTGTERADLFDGLPFEFLMDHFHQQPVTCQLFQVNGDHA